MTVKSQVHFIRVSLKEKKIDKVITYKLLKSVRKNDKKLLL